MRKLTLAAFGAGYLLGTKAGRERYEQLVELARATKGKIEEYRSNAQAKLPGLTLEDSASSLDASIPDKANTGGDALLEGDSMIHEFLRQTKYRRAG